MKKQSKVLLIDDEAQIRSVFVSYFEDYDEFDIITASSAEEALNRLETGPADLCIVDMRLPGMDGKEFISRARASCRHFLVHTGSIDEDLFTKLQDMGVASEDYLLKPCDMPHLLARLRKHLGSALPDD
jgi:DNA-binding response OmpR family regulator